MKILYYSPHPNLNLQASTGYGTHMREMIQAFEQLGHEVLPVIMGGVEAPLNGHKLAQPGGLKRMVKTITPNYIWSSLKDVQLLRYDKQTAGKTLETQIREFEPDLIYERCNYLQTSGVRLAQQYDIPHILEVNAPYVEERVVLSGKSHFLDRATELEREQQEGSSKIVVVSSALKQYFLDKYQLEASKYVVTPNAIDMDKVKASEQTTEDLRASLGLEDQVVIGFVGSVFPWHGVDILVKAFSLLMEEWQGIRLLVVGGGQYLTEIQKIAEKLRLGDRAIFTGKVPFEEVFSYIDVMDITVLANSHWYGSPVKIFEYGAMGKAIIAPDNVPVKDVMVDGEDGLLVRPEVNEAYKALVRLLADPALRLKMGQNFQQKVKEKHSWVRMAEKILQA